MSVAICTKCTASGGLFSKMSSNDNFEDFEAFDISLVNQGIFNVHRKFHGKGHIGKFYVDSKKVSKKFLHRHYPVLKILKVFIFSLFFKVFFGCFLKFFLRFKCFYPTRILEFIIIHCSFPWNFWSTLKIPWVTSDFATCYHFFVAISVQSLGLKTVFRGNDVL